MLHAMQTSLKYWAVVSEANFRTDEYGDDAVTQLNPCRELSLVLVPGEDWRERQHRSEKGRQARNCRRS